MGSLDGPKVGRFRAHCESVKTRHAVVLSAIDMQVLRSVHVYNDVYTSHRAVSGDDR